MNSYWTLGPAIYVDVTLDPTTQLSIAAEVFFPHFQSGYSDHTVVWFGWFGKV